MIDDRTWNVRLLTYVFASVRFNFSPSKSSWAFRRVGLGVPPSCTTVSFGNTIAVPIILQYRQPLFTWC